MNNVETFISEIKKTDDAVIRVSRTGGRIRVREWFRKPGMEWRAGRGIDVDQCHVAALVSGVLRAASERRPA